ncbi:MAG: hypothetical protein F4Y01_15965 [Gammaproteobacteria bacterium]|nr:hypothetical protein [Gammaproteobacteria bacterium]
MSVALGRLLRRLVARRVAFPGLHHRHDLIERHVACQVQAPDTAVSVGGRRDTHLPPLVFGAFRDVDGLGRFPVHAQFRMCRADGACDQHQFAQVEMIGVESRAAIDEAVEPQRCAVGVGVLVDGDFDADVVAAAAVVGVDGRAAERHQENRPDGGAGVARQEGHSVSHVRVLHSSHSPCDGRLHTAPAKVNRT